VRVLLIERSSENSLNVIVSYFFYMIVGLTCFNKNISNVTFGSSPVQANITKIVSDLSFILDSLGSITSLDVLLRVYPTNLCIFIHLGQ
jgi:hypothetical protein